LNKFEKALESYLKNIEVEENHAKEQESSKALEIESILIEN